MKIDVRKGIADYHGDPVTESQPDPENAGKIIEVAKPLREYFSTALNNALPNEVMTPEDKTKAYDISTKLFASNEPNLTSEQITFLKGRILKVFLSPLVCGRLIDILEQNDEREKPLESGKADQDLTNVAAKDPAKSVVQPNRSANKPDGGE